MTCLSGRTGGRVAYLAKAGARRAVWGPADLVGRDGGGRPRPPRRLASVVGDGDFAQIGDQFLDFLVRLGGLRPDARVLDVGCGVGRMAMPLTGYLTEGSYAGFDVHRQLVRWCQGNITPQWPEFEFTWANVYNGKYNPFGDQAADEFPFPYPDSCFDFVFAASVFTHLRRRDVRHYLGEAARVLRPGGTCLLTFFLLTPEAERAIAAGAARYSFSHRFDGGMSASRCRPEKAVAYPEREVRALLTGAGLRVRETHYGAWCRTDGAETLQDIVVAERV